MVLSGCAAACIVFVLVGSAAQLSSGSLCIYIIMKNEKTSKTTAVEVCHSL